MTQIHPRRFEEQVERPHLSHSACRCIGLDIPLWSEGKRPLELQAPVWEEMQEELLVPDVGSRYVELRVPTLVLVGSENVSDIREIADRLTSGIPGARKVVIAGTARVPSLERPEEFDRLVLDFLGTS